MSKPSSAALNSCTLDSACTGATARIPVEMWERIFEAACIDDGTTGRSLSQVSHYLRAVSFGWKNHSVALRGPSQILAFYSIVRDAETPRELKRVYNLFVDLKSGCTGGDDEEEIIDRAANSLSTIVDAVAPNVRRLTCIAADVHIEDIISAPLPRLVELTLVDQSRRFKMFKKSFNDPWEMACQPALRRLHVTGIGSVERAVPLVRAASHLTHLRITGVVRFIPRPLIFATRDLRCARTFRTHPSGQNDPTAAAARAFAHLKQFVLQPASRPERNGWCGTPQANHGIAVKTFICFAKVNPFVRVLPVPVHAPSEDDYFRQWLERNEGGPGCWVGE